MKKVLSVFLCLALLFSLSAQSVFAAISQSELDEFLHEIQWTESELYEYLDFYEWDISEFGDLEDLIEFLGPVLTEERLTELLEEYGVSQSELAEFMQDEFGEDISDIKFEDDLLFYLFVYTDEEWEWSEEEWEEFYNDYNELIEEIYNELSELFDEIDLTLEEFKRLVDHFEYVFETTDDLFDRLFALDERINALPDFESADELTAEEIAEILSIFKEMANIFQLDFKFYLINGDEKKPVTFTELMKITDLDGYALLIELYNHNGEFLADIIITADMFGSELIKETGSELKNVTTEVKTAEEKAPVKPVNTEKDEAAPVAKTEKGGKLPETASDYPLHVLLGLLLAGAGVVMFRKVKAA